MGSISQYLDHTYLRYAINKKVDRNNEKLIVMNKMVFESTDNDH